MILFWPSINTFIGDSTIDIMDSNRAKLVKMPRINFLRRWTNFCFSFDFPANEAKIAMSGNTVLVQPSLTL